MASKPVQVICCKSCLWLMCLVFRVLQISVPSVFCLPPSQNLPKNFMNTSTRRGERRTIKLAGVQSTISFFSVGHAGYQD